MNKVEGKRRRGNYEKQTLNMTETAYIAMLMLQMTANEADISFGKVTDVNIGGQTYLLLPAIREDLTQFIYVRRQGNYIVSFLYTGSTDEAPKIKGYFDYVVPPLEGFWWQDGVGGIDYTHKEKFQWISLIRLPDFVTKADFDWAVAEAAEKKKTDFSKVKFMTYTEGLCVQCMHIGSYDTEPETIRMMEEFAGQNGYAADFSQGRYHHEIYLSDARRCRPDKLKTVIRHPVKKEEKL